MTKRRGFALLAVLWLVVALGGLTAGTLAAARAGADVTARRTAALRGRWAAEGCLAAALSALDSAVRARGEFALPALEPIRYANGTACEVQARDPNATRDSVYGDGRINVNAAPDSVLLALPGLGADAIRVLAAARGWRRPIVGLDELLYQLPASAQSALTAHYAELAPLLAFRAASLVLTAHGSVAGHPGAARVELHVASAGGRVAVLRRRVW